MHLIFRSHVTLPIIQTVTLSLALASRCTGTNADTPAPGKAGSPGLLAAYGQLPLSFEPGPDQAGDRGSFIARGPGYAVLLTPNEAVIGLRNASASAAGNVVRMQLLGANPKPLAHATKPLAGKIHYLRGNDPSGWRTHVPIYGRVEYCDVYEGVDLIYHGNQRQLEYDFALAPGADPQRIALRFEGVEQLEVEANGDLMLRTTVGPLRFQKPFAYQEENGVRSEVPCTYALDGKDQVRFCLADYDRCKPLVIDPVLAYATFLGGSSLDVGDAIAVDGDGSVYVAGQTASFDFPTSTNNIPLPYQIGFGGGVHDAFVTKLDPGGSNLVYSTYLGGGGVDAGLDIVVDSAGSAYITGTTSSTNFPTTAGAFQSGFIPGGAFVTKLDPTGSALVYSTYLRGTPNDAGHGIAVDSSGNAYVTGRAEGPGFPVTTGAAQTNFIGGISDVFVAKLDASGSNLVYSMLFGDFFIDQGNAIAVDSAGNAYVVGSTEPATNFFPTTSGAFQTTHRGGARDGFVTKVDPSGSNFVYSTFLGSSGADSAYGVAVDGAGNVYVAGTTDSITNFPTTTNAFQYIGGGGEDAFVVKLDATGSSLQYGSYLGGSGDDNANDIALDSTGNMYIAGGLTSPLGFPVLNAFQINYGGGVGEAFVAMVSPAGSLIFSSWFGAEGGETVTEIVVDSLGNAYVTGITGVSTNFPVTAGAFQVAHGGFTDAFVVKIVEGNTPIGTNVVVQPTQVTTGIANLSVTYSNVFEVGTTTVTTTNSGPPVPTGFALGSVEEYYEVATSAGVSGRILLCVNYTGISFAFESAIKLFHYEGGTWVDCTVSLDTVNDIVCGEVTSLSPFALFEEDVTPPTVSCSVGLPMFSSPNHDLVNVGLAATVNDDFDASPTVQVRVFADENDEDLTAPRENYSPDARNIALGTLRLRNERKNSGDGRVYLIVVKATDDRGNVGFSCTTVVVPKSSSQSSITAVNQQAAAARAFCNSHNGAAPAGYTTVGDGPTIGPKQ